MNALLDTEPLVAMLNRPDIHHRWAVQEADRCTGPFVSCEAVITEAHFLLTRTRTGNAQLNRMIEAGRIDLSFSYADHVREVNDLMRTYANVPMAFADACLVRLAEIHDDGRIFTTDGDFHIYRKNRRQTLAVLMP